VVVSDCHLAERPEVRYICGMRFAPALLTAIVALPVPAMAGFNTGNEVVTACKQDRFGYCLGYTTGLVDAITNEPGTKGQICLRESLTAGQVRDVLVKWLDDNPGKRDYTASSIARVALQEAFPCR